MNVQCVCETAQTSEAQPPQTLVDVIQEAVVEATRSLSDQNPALSGQNSASDVQVEEEQTVSTTLSKCCLV